MEQRKNGVSDDIPLAEYLTLIARSRKLILLSIICGLGAGFMLTKIMPATYESTARIIINPHVRQGSPPVVTVAATEPANKLMNELEALVSNGVVETAARRLLDKAAAGEHLPMIAEAAAQGGDSLHQLRRVMDVIRGAVDFNPVKESDIIKITARSGDPSEAAVVVNVYTNVYRELSIDASRKELRDLREFLSDQLEQKHNTLDSAESTLQAYMRRSGMTSLSGESGRVVEQLAQLEADRDALDVDITARTNTLASLREEFKREEPSVAVSMGESNDTYIRLLQDQLAQLEVQRDVALAQKANGGDVYEARLKEINTQIDALRTKLRQRTQDFLQQLSPGHAGASPMEGSAAYLASMKQRIIEQEIELGGLQARRGALDRVVQEHAQRFNALPKKNIEFARLERSRLSTERLYLMIEEKYNQTAIAERSEFGYITVLDAGIVPVLPVSPKLWLNLLIGFLVGSAFGVSGVLLRSSSGTFFRTPEDLRRHGYKPLTVVSRVKRVPFDGKTNGHGSSPPTTGKGSDARHLILSDPMTPFAESYRHLQVQLLAMIGEKGHQSILVTSAQPNEGKTMTATNLAITYAHAGFRVLLLDADLRRPSVHRLFDLPIEPGLTDLLMTQMHLDRVLHWTAVPGLNVLCAGSPVPNPAPVIGSKRMQDLFMHLMENLDILIVDTPPLLAVAEGGLLVSKVDHVLLVVEAGATRVTSLRKAHEFVETMHGHVAGVVLNKFDVRRDYRGDYREGGYGYYGYRKGYYARDAEDKRDDRR